MITKLWLCIIYLNKQMCMFFKYVKVCCLCGFIPDWTVPCIQVLCSHCTNNNSCGRVFICLHAVGRPAEDGRLLHIQHSNLYCGRVFIWAEVEEVWVQVRVWCHHFETVGLSVLIVQRLQSTGNRGFNLVSLDSGPRHSHAFTNKSQCQNAAWRTSFRADMGSRGRSPAQFPICKQLTNVRAENYVTRRSTPFH